MNVKLETHVLPNGQEIKVQSKPENATRHYDKSTTSMGKDLTRRGKVATATKVSK